MGEIITMTRTPAASKARLNLRAEPAAAAPDPPHKRHRVSPTLTLNMTTIERLALWQELSDSEGINMVAVERRALLHLLLDHATLLTICGVSTRELLR